MTSLQVGDIAYSIYDRSVVITDSSELFELLERGEIKQVGFYLVADIKNGITVVSWLATLDEGAFNVPITPVFQMQVGWSVNTMSEAEYALLHLMYPTRT